MSTINTNISALVANNALRINSRNMAQAMERLSTGKRINSGADDPAGIAVSARLEAASRADRVGIRNANDAISMLQTWSSAGQNVLNAVIRMKELSVQASTDTLRTADRYALNNEFRELGLEWTRIAATTRWNNLTGYSAATNITIRVGDGAAASSSLVILNKDWSPNNGTTGANVTGSTSVSNATPTAVTAFDFTTLDQTSIAGSAAEGGVPAAVANTRAKVHLQSLAAATAMVTRLDTVITGMTRELAQYGSYVNRLEVTVDSLSATANALDSSRSKIEDADYAVESTELSRTQIIAQAATAILAQANTSQQTVLALLQ